MKKYLIILALMASIPLFADHVDPETARKVATTFLTNNGAKIDQLTDLSKAAGFSNLYIFSTNESFVIVSSDDCFQPILGYSTENPFGTKKMPDNLFYWLEGYDEEIAYAVKNRQKATNEVEEGWKQLLTGTLPKPKGTPSYLIQTQWDQGDPYNYYCPTGTVTGCVATAMAQIMKYHNYPDHGFGSHSYIPAAHPDYGQQSVDFGTATYDWDNMTNTYGLSSTNPQKQAVAKLMYHCGVSVNMNYGTSAEGGSSATTSDVAASLRNYFNYSQSVRPVFKSSYSSQQWTELLSHEISENRPIQYWGSRKKEDGKTVGHSFICDGYNSENNKFHFNWGWGGSSDGWFYITGNETPQTLYPLIQGAIIGIQPIDYEEQPTELVVSVSGRTVNLTWTGLASADSYNVYRDYNLIGSTSSCTFTDANVTIGTHLYFVRGVKNDNVSLPSNLITQNVTFGGTMEELKIDHLQASHNNGDVTLEWSAPYRLNYIDYHSLESEWYYTGTGEITTLYWGARFPASMLTEGTTLNSVSYLFNTAGTYSTYIFQCTDGIPSGDTLLKVTRDYPKGWNNVVFPSSITINPEKDLWIVFKSTDIPYPITLAELNSDDGNYYSEDGDHWYHFSGCSFFISANLSNGDFTYKIYDGNTKVVENLSTPSHTLSEIGSGVHQYSVKAQKGEETSTASNKIGFTLGTASIASLSLGDEDQMTLTSGSSLTVNGEISNTDPDNLIIEDGAQLIHPYEAVATLIKTINAYSTTTGVNDGWYTIASPVDTANVRLATTGDYDLYTYDEKNVLWLNQKNPANDIAHFAEGLGVLYANADNQSLSFAGGMKATNAQVSIPLSYQSTNTSLRGFNLVGNPFTRNLNDGDIKLGETLITTYYVVEGGSELEARAIATYPIKPGQGFLVQATAEDQNLVFNPTSKDDNPVKPNFISIEVSKEEFTDRAYVQIGNGNMLRKMTLNEDAAQISIIKDKADYAAVTIEESEKEVAINFKANQDGTYTLHFETENFDPDYLHLVDLLTGTDIDLLVTQSYSFEAKINDYPSRFQLVLYKTTNSNDTDSDITDGKTEILDLTGRIVATNSNAKLTPGVYLLRTINGNDIKTEKIIIK